MRDPLDDRLAGLAGHAERLSAPPPAAAIRRRARRRTAVTGLAAAGLVLAGLGAAFAVVPHPAPPAPAVSTGPAPSAAATTSAAVVTPPITGAPPTGSSAPPAGPGSPPAGPGPSSTTPSGDAPVPCRTATGLRTTAGATEAGSTHRSLRVVFVNAGTAPCRMRGYPGVAALNQAGEQVEQARRTMSGYLGGVTSITTVTIPVGQSASAVVEADGARADGSGCPAYAGLLVTPPDDTAATRLDWSTDSCANLQIHPVEGPG